MAKHTASFKRQYLEQACREWWQDRECLSDKISECLERFPELNNNPEDAVYLIIWHQLPENGNERNQHSN